MRVAATIRLSVMHDISEETSKGCLPETCQACQQRRPTGFLSSFSSHCLYGPPGNMEFGHTASARRC